MSFCLECEKRSAHVNSALCPECEAATTNMPVGVRMNSMCCLVQDNDCHWYVIPVDRFDDWGEWCEIDSEDERAWTPPEYATEVGGAPSLVHFSSWEISHA